MCVKVMQIYVLVDLRKYCHPQNRAEGLAVRFTLSGFIPDFYNKAATELSENQNPWCAPIMPTKPTRQTVQLFSEREDILEQLVWHQQCIKLLIALPPPTLLKLHKLTK